MRILAKSMSDRSANTHDDNDATLLVVDGHSLAFRAFYALPVENFTTSTGQPTNAVWGFATMLAQVVETERPKYLAVGFDVKGGTFRNTMLPEYKATRALAPEDLLTQLPLIQKLLNALGITYIEKSGFEDHGCKRGFAHPRTLRGSRCFSTHQRPCHRAFSRPSLQRFTAHGCPSGHRQV